MFPQGGGGGSRGGALRPGRGDVDLEALQDAFIRSAERPSAKVTRSKPPSIKGGSHHQKEGDISRLSTRAQHCPPGAMPSPGGSATSTARTAKSTALRSNEINGSDDGHLKEDTTSRNEHSQEEQQPQQDVENPSTAPLTPGPPIGGMVLSAPGVVSSVREREAKAPQPMKIGIGESALGGSSSRGNHGGGKSVRRDGKRSGLSLSAGDSVALGGFPVVRHRSEMGVVKLGRDQDGGRRGAKGGASEGSNGRQPSPRDARGSRDSATSASTSTNDDRGISSGIPSDIHQENISRVSTMSADDVAEAQQEIRSALSPEAIEMLMRRGRRGRGKASGKPPEHTGKGAFAASAKPSGLAATEAHTERSGAVIHSPNGACDGFDNAGDVTTEEDDGAGASSASLGTAPDGRRGAPTGAQRAATAAGGIDSEEALAAAVLSLPLEERIKSSWTMSGADGRGKGDNGESKGGEARVDLDGAVVRELSLDGEAGTKGGNAHVALHHHGEDPDKAGYTPSELVRLTRSTVAGQRQLALRALSGVLRRRAVSINRGQRPAHPRLPEMLPVAVRLGMDDSNPAVSLAALTTMEALLAPLAPAQEAEEDVVQSLSWLDYQAFPSEPRPLCTPEEETALPSINDAEDSVQTPNGDHAVGGGINEGEGGDGDEIKSAAEFARLCYEDPCKGLLKMMLLPKLTSILRECVLSSKTGSWNSDGDDGGEGKPELQPQPQQHRSGGGLHARAALSCLRVLCATARRAPWAASKVAHEPGLLDAVREAFLEPDEDGSLPLDLFPQRNPPTRLVNDSKALPANAFVRDARQRSTTSRPKERSSLASPAQLVLIAVRFARILVQSGREVALFLATTPVLGSTKGLLALGQGSASTNSQGTRPASAALCAVQREVLELWRCCLSYGIDVQAADTVVLVSRGHGWWPGLATTEEVTSSASYSPPLDQARAAKHALDDVHDAAAFGDAAAAAAAAAGVLAIPISLAPRLAFYRALHQLACASVSPPGKRGETPSDDHGSDGSGKPTKRVTVRPNKIVDEKDSLVVSGAGAAGDDAPVATGGVSVIPRMWEDVGGTVDAAVEAAVAWLLSGGRYGDNNNSSGVDGSGQSSSRVTGSPSSDKALSQANEVGDRGLQAAAIHLVACWLERYQAISRDPVRRAAAGRLEATAEDTAVLLSSLLSSRTLLPSAVTAAVGVAGTATVKTNQAAETGKSAADTMESGNAANSAAAARTLARPSSSKTPPTSSGSGPMTVASTSTHTVAEQAAATAGLDWLTGVFRLGLACEKTASGEAAAALAAAPQTTVAALATFLATPAYSHGVNTRDNGALTREIGGEDGVGPGKGIATRGLQRAAATARWLGCRFTAYLAESSSVKGTHGTGEGGKGKAASCSEGRSWAALRRDCALQAVSLCQPGDEAVAVGLVAEGLPDSLADESIGEEPHEGIAGSSAALLLRKLFRGAISDSVAFSQSAFHLDGRWASLQSLRAVPPPGTASLLPLPRHWLFLPLASQGGERAASTAVSACLTLLVRLEEEGSSYVVDNSPCLPHAARSIGGSASTAPNNRSGSSTSGVDSRVGQGGSWCVSPEVKLYHLANACLYGATVLSEKGADKNFEWLLRRYLEQCGKGFEERLTTVISRLSLGPAPDPAKMIADAAATNSNNAHETTGNPRAGVGDTARDRVLAARNQSHTDLTLTDFVKDLVASFLADSFGLPSFAQVLRVFLAIGFPASARCIVWKELGAVGLLPLLDPPSSVPASTCSNNADKCDGIADRAAIDPAASRLIAFKERPYAANDSRKNGGSEQHTTVRDVSCSPRAAHMSYLFPPDVDSAIIDAYLTALEHPRFGPREEHQDDQHHRDQQKQQQQQVPAECSMRAVAVHHVTCYLFPPAHVARHGTPCDERNEVANDGNNGDQKLAEARDMSRAADADSGTSPPWRPDFGRRKAFETLMRMRDGGSVAVGVVSHKCSGTDDAAGVHGKCSRAQRYDGNRENSEGHSTEKSDITDPGAPRPSPAPQHTSPSAPPSTLPSRVAPSSELPWDQGRTAGGVDQCCSYDSRLSKSRRQRLEMYCAQDVLPSIETRANPVVDGLEEGREVDSVVKWLRARFA